MWKFKFRSQQTFEKIEFFFKIFWLLFYLWSLLLVMLGIQTLRYLSRVSVLALKISRYIVFITNRTFYLHELFETGILIYYPAVFLWFFFFIPFSFVEVCVWFFPSHSSCSSCGWGVSLLYQTDKPKVNWNTNFWHEKLFFRLSVLYYKLNQVGYLTNTFHFAVGLFSYRLQMSNCGKK